MPESKGMKLKLPDKPFVLVIWGDAFKQSDEETEEDSADQAPVLCYTVGWLVRDNEKGLAVYSEFSPEHSKPWRDRTFVPKGMLIEVIELPKPTRRPKKKMESPRDG